MRILLLLSVFLIGKVCLAQDPDFPDTRNKRESFTRIQDKDMRRDISSFAMAGLDEGVGKQPLRSLKMIGFSSDSMSFEGEGISVKIKAGAFDATKHKLSYYTNTETNKKYLTRIDSRPFYGDYGKMPNTTIDNITVLFGADTVAIPKESYADLYNPIFSYTENGVEKYINNVYLSADGKTVYIYMLKREQGGSYEVTWVIQNGQYVRRVVDFGFLRN